MKSKQRYITLPETWDELTEADWREVLKIRHLVATTDHAWTVEDVRIETARAMLQNRGVKQQLNNSQWLTLVSQLAQSLDWLWKADDSRLSLVYRSTVNLLPNAGRWLGPLSHGEDLVFGEFRQAITHLKNYETDQNHTALCALAGLLYRPEASKEMKCERQLRRQPYDWDDIEQKIRRGQGMKPWQVWGIYAWFAFFCEHLTTGIFIIEGQEVCFSPLFRSQESGSESRDSGGGMQQICLTLAESHVFGTAKDVDNTPLLTVMQKLLMDYNTLQKFKNKKI